MPASRPSLRELLATGPGSLEELAGSRLLLLFDQGRLPVRDQHRLQAQAGPPGGALTGDGGSPGTATGSGIGPGTGSAPGTSRRDPTPEG